ncbi:putative polypeptide N-acetylgalactosaminyltransferase 10 [Gigantopelta aegis]|uniref:putative polypeptide N-acetylgalactosaminyltransferase 10 n=1 Tax=Gigantopelta aegis TaxID=1735272 RepID=UPI001B889F1C|nr:putative polypeptide N-acetylgalactosaminyltransferase 10 [Gigantopelta aegis]
MRRHTATILKYVFYIAMLITVGLLFHNRRKKANVEDFSNMEQKRSHHDHHDGRRHHRHHNILELLKHELKKIDWHDYKLIETERKRKGPGEQGAALIPSKVNETAKQRLYHANGFNAYVSDMIALDRSINDIRHEGCRRKLYLSKLPTVTIVIPFHNEHFSALLRTVHSIINRSPKHLIKEILLIDDYSNKEFLKEKLDDYLKEHFTNVRVIRAKKREGLIRARLLGAKLATGQVLIFLDSHCEANINWLPPLLEPIAEDKRTVTCPFIDVIDYETFSYKAQDEGARGAFDWNFLYKRLPVLKSHLEHPAEPFKSPIMAGGLFAINREWFWTLGGYDPGLEIWGGEQYELSFKIWQCGGKMVDIPCSRIGHIYRKFVPYNSGGNGNYYYRNMRRVADVWMDEYIEFLIMRRPFLKTVDSGDISQQRAIRKRLKCKPFKWFMTEIAFDIVDYYPLVEPKPMANGEIRNMASQLCIDTRFKGQNERFQLEECISDRNGGAGEQRFEFTWHKDIRPRKREYCFDTSMGAGKVPIILFRCHNQKGNQRFKYNVVTSQIYHPVAKKCLDCDVNTHELFMNYCEKDSKTQKWKWSNVNVTALKEDWDLVEMIK